MSDLTTPLGMEPPRRGNRVAGILALCAVAVTLAATAAFMLAGGDNVPAADKAAEVAGIPEVIADETPETAVGSGAPSRLPARFTIAEMPLEPLPALQEDGEYGRLPRIGDDGLRPLEAYARPAPATDGQPMIAIVVTGLGRSDIGSGEALDSLPPDITLVAAPDGTKVETWTAAARRAGHEILLEVPLSTDAADARIGLVPGASAGENRLRLHRIMAATGSYAGLYFPSADLGQLLEPVLAEAAGRGLMVAGSDQFQLDAATAAGVDGARGDALLDTVAREAAILEQLARLEAHAAEHGSAIGIASALPASVRTIGAWAETLKSRGYVLVPLSAIRVPAPRMTEGGP
jgi:uncharacterized protein